MSEITQVMFFGSPQSDPRPFNILTKTCDCLYPGANYVSFLESR